MKGIELQNAILALIEAHPDIKKSSWGHTEHSLRFHAEKTHNPLAIEPKRVRFQNIWVTAKSVDLVKLGDIRFEAYDQKVFYLTKPNHSLFGDIFFQKKDLVCFKVTDLWQAARIILEVAGPGPKT